MFAITSNEVDATLDTATILPFKCIENYTVDEFKECVGKNKRSPFLKVNLEDYEHKVNTLCKALLLFGNHLSLALFLMISSPRITSNAIYSIA